MHGGSRVNLRPRRASAVTESREIARRLRTSVLRYSSKFEGIHEEYPMPRASTPRPSHAFTLTELLVVLLIIALLISILVPTVAAARSRAAATQCKANLRGIGQALRMYLNENKDRYPLAPALPSVNREKYPTLMEHLRKYITKSADEDLALFRCPADEQTYPVEKTSYLYNSELGVGPVEETYFYKVFQSKHYVVSVFDALDYHGRALPIHCLFLDGRVEQVAKPKELP
jgi:prepilin-type N-terminal cleavage/methylation domain-containing protein